jgi:hypothetical protein
LLSGSSQLGSAVANVTYHGGPLLTNVQVESVYYGQPWSTDPTLQQQVQQIDTFLPYFVTSPYFATLKQYNAGYGSYLNDVIISQDPPGGQSIDDTQIQQHLNSEISGHQLSTPTANSLYILFTAPGVVVTDNGQNSVNNFAGYHSFFTDSAGAGVYYAVIPYPNGGVSALQLTTFQQDTLILSHEIAEAVTDPDTQSGWFDPQQGEIGDIAEGTSGVLGGYVVQGVWSQSAGQVVIPSATPSSSLTVTGDTVQGSAGQPLTVIVATITGADPSAAADSFAASITWGDGNTSTGTVTTDPNGGFDISGTNTYAQAGSYPITVTVKDLSGTVVGTAMSQANIGAAPSTISAQGTQISAIAGQVFSGVVATFTDSNSQVTAGSFTVTIDWGDGATSAGTVTPAANGGFEVTGSHAYSTGYLQLSGFPWGGPFDWGHGSLGTQDFVVTVTIEDNLDNASAAVESLAVVTPAPPAINATGRNVQATSGVPFTAVVATFTVANSQEIPASFAATIDWGDGTTSTGTVTVDGNGGFEVTGTHTYTTSASDPFGWTWWSPFQSLPQQFEIETTITENGTQNQGGAQSVATVWPMPPALSVTAQNIQATAGQVFSGVVATFTDVNAGSKASDFTATISWGDVASSQGTITADLNGGFDVTGSHTYGNPDYTSVWGDPGAGFGDGSSSFGIGEQSYRLTVSVTNLLTSDTGIDHALAIVLPAPANLLASGTLITTVSGVPSSGTVATFTSLDTNPTAGNFTATIDWGDGTTSTGTITANAQGGFTVRGTHTYTNSDEVDIGSDWQRHGFDFGHHGRHSGIGDNLYVITVTITDQTNQNTAQALTLVSMAPAAPGATETTIGTAGGSQPPNASGGGTGGNGGVPTLPVTPVPVLSPQSFGVAVAQSFAGTVATFSDAGGAGAGSFTATISWGDGQTASGQILAPGNGTYQIVGTHVYLLVGSYSVSITLQDADGTSATCTGLAVVVAVPGQSGPPAQLYQVAMLRVLRAADHHRLPDLPGERARRTGINVMDHPDGTGVDRRAAGSRFHWVSGIHPEPRRNRRRVGGWHVPRLAGPLAGCLRIEWLAEAAATRSVALVDRVWLRGQGRAGGAARRRRLSAVLWSNPGFVRDRLLGEPVRGRQDERTTNRRPGGLDGGLPEALQRSAGLDLRSL